MATIYEPSGLDRPCRPRNGKKFVLDELQQLVGGYIEMVRIPGDVGRRVFIVDEEGRLKGLKPRFAAPFSASRSFASLEAGRPSAAPWQALDDPEEAEVSQDAQRPGVRQFP